MTQTPLTHRDVERILKKNYPRVHHVLYVDREPQRGGISNAIREQMRVYFQTKQLGTEQIDLVAKQGSKIEYYLMQALYRRKALSGRIPRPLAYSKGTLLYRRLWGDEFRRFPFVDRKTELNRLCSEVGILLAEIHNTPLPAHVNTIVRTQRERKRDLAEVTKQFPDVMKRFDVTIPPTPKTAPTALIHGDFQASNLIITLPHGKIGAIDFAAGGRGNPTTDIAGFLIHTELMLRGTLSRNTIDKGLDAFLQSYRRHRRKALHRDFTIALKAAKFDVLLSILGTTVAHLPPRDKNYEPVVGYLYKKFHE